MRVDWRWPKRAARRCLNWLKQSPIQRITETWLHRVKLSWHRVTLSFKSWLSTPWSIQRVAHRDEVEWRRFNQRRKALALSRVERDLLFAGEHPIRFSLSLLGLLLVGSLFAFVMPAATFVPNWTEWKDAENLAHFSTLWAVQTTLAALVYPIVIAFVTVYLQRRPGAEAFVQLYVLDSGALAAGLSSLTLVVVMGAQYVLLPYSGASRLRDWAAFDAVWFLLNAVLTACFLFRTVDFLRPEVQSRVIRRYTINVALPREVYRLNLFQVLAQAQSKGWLPGPSYLDTAAPDGPRIVLSRLSFGKGQPQGMFRFREPSRLVNVRLWPLRLALGWWMYRARRWPRPSGPPARRQYSWPLLTVAATPGSEYRESVHLATVESGPPLAYWQRALISWACVFRPLRLERFEIRVKAILGELEAEAGEAAGNARVESFDRSYEPLVGLHTLLLGASLAKGEDGSIGSWAVLPDILTAFERPVYIGWADTYRSLFLASIAAMEVNARPIQRLCNLVQHLHGNDLNSSPVEVRENVLQLPPLMMYQLGAWWTRRVEEQGIVDHGPHRMAVLLPPHSRVYEEVVASFVGGWENARTLVADIPSASKAFAWASAQVIAQLNWVHLQDTARMLLSAVLRGDQVGAEWLADVVTKWWGSIDSDHQAFVIFDKADFVTVEHLRLEWARVSALLNITEADITWGGGRVETMQRAVLIAAIRNLWTDTRLLVLELLLFVAGKDTSTLADSLAINIAVGLLRGQQWRSGGTLTDSLSDLTAPKYLATKVRQYAADGDVRGGYEQLLSRLIARVKDMERPGMIASRAYSFSGADDLDSLQEQQLLVFALLSNRDWRAGEPLRRQIDIWVSQRYESIELVRHTVDSWLQRLNLDQEQPPNVLDALFRRTEKTHNPQEGRDRTKAGIESLRDVVEGARTEALAAQPIDSARLLQIAQFASSKGFSAASGKFPLQLFRSLEYSTEILQDYTLVRKQVPKGELTRVAMDQRAGNEEQYWAETLALHVGALALSDIIGGTQSHDLFVPDPGTFWSALKAETTRFAARDTHPILILDNATRPEWVWHWTHAEQGSEYRRPDDLTVRRVAGRGAGYVCDFNDIEVYVGPLSPGYSLLLAREAFRSITFTEFEHGRYVDVACDARTDSRVLIDMKLRLSRRVEVGDVHLVRFRYASDSTESPGS
jgi:hypothetical protein